MVDANSQHPHVTQAHPFEARLEGEVKLRQRITADPSAFDLGFIVLVKQVAGHGGHHRA